MAPHNSSSNSESSSDDEGAPETISLAQSKKEIQKLDAELQKAEIAARKSKKSQNREMDRKLKERADMNRGGKQKGDDDDGDDEVGGLEARMNRAMQEAQEEMDDDGESGSVGDSEKDSDDKEEQEDVGSLEDEQSSEEEEEEEKAETSNPLKKIKYNANHLPDELFTAAFASKASTSKRKAPDDNKEDNLPKQTSKKPKRSHTRRDLIVGYAFRFIFESTKTDKRLIYFFKLQ